jgi:hypothetical protein
LLQEPVKSTVDIQSYTRFLVSTDWSCKGKYPSLQALLSRIGAKRIILASPDIFSSIIDVLGVASVNTQASILYGQLATDLVKEISQQEWEDLILVPIVEAIGAADQYKRNAIYTYLMPKLIKIDPRCVIYMLDRLRELRNKRFTLEYYGDNYLLSVIQTMKIAKTSGVLQQEDCKFFMMYLLIVIVQRNENVIREGLIHGSEDIRLSTFDLIITSLKTTEPPTELDLLEQFFVLNLKNSGPLFRYNYQSIMNRFFKRIRDSSYKIYNVYERKKNIDLLFSTAVTHDVCFIFTFFANI